MNLTESLAYLHGKPELKAQIRVNPEDFKVTESLGFEPSGEGEHLWLWIEKIGQNTSFISQQLAHHFNLNPREVNTSGMKDRHAVTYQWFNVPFPIKQALPKSIKLNGAKVLAMHRHGRKLKTGTHKANLFEITLRFDALNKLSETALVNRLMAIKAQGVPNYFGEQRFGHNGGNVDKARDFFAGKFKVRDKKKRGIYISAARSLIFNQVVDQRIQADLIKPLDGDVFILSGTNSHFSQVECDDEIYSRYDSGDIVLSAPLWGEGVLKSSFKVQTLEQKVAEQHGDLCAGLIDLRLKQERRALLLKPQDFNWQFGNGFLTLNFALGSGCFATSVLREIADYQDASLLKAQAAHDE